MSTLQKTKGSHTEDISEKIHCTLEYLIPKDREAEAVAYREGGLGCSNSPLKKIPKAPQKKVPNSTRL